MAIQGSVYAFREAIILLQIQNTVGHTHDIEAVIDTGFDGYLTLPRAQIEQLGLPWQRRGRAILADGSESVFDVYEAVIEWDGELRRIAVDAADTDPLLGMSLLYGYELTIQAIDGGQVVIRKLIDNV